jgi:hypothetical protein
MVEAGRSILRNEIVTDCKYSSYTRLLNFAYFATTVPGCARLVLTAGRKPVNCIFAMATQPNPIEEVVRDFEFPQREAAFFYGLFLRGHSPDKLRQDIQVPASVLAKWDKETAREPQLREILDRMVRYRRHVLAIFENLIDHDSTPQRVQ